MARTKKQTILEAVMAEPVTIGGFNFAYGFALTKLRESGVREHIADMTIFYAQNRNFQPNAPDARKLSAEKCEQLWDAMGDGNMPVINALYREIRNAA
jgi:hypothetical protein